MADSNTPTKGGNQPVTTPNGKTPTSSDAMFFFMIVKNMKSKADIDWAGVAVDHGFKNAEVAKVRFGQVKRKLGIGESSTPTKIPAKSPAKATTPKEAKVKKTPAGRTSTKGKKGKKGGNDDKVKMEDIPDSKVKGEDVEDDDAEAQLQADMDKYINPDGEVEPLF